MSSLIDIRVTRHALASRTIHGSIIFCYTDANKHLFPITAQSADAAGSSVPFRSMEHTSTPSVGLSALEAELAALCGKLKNTFMANGRQYHVRDSRVMTKLRKGTVDVSPQGVRIHNARISERGLLSASYAELQTLAEEGSDLAKAVLLEVHDAFEGIRQRVASIDLSTQLARESAIA